MTTRVDVAAGLLLGRWESTEAFGNTALDWSKALKDQRARLELCFARDGSYDFRMLEATEATEAADVTASFRHVIASQGTYELQGENGILIHGDKSGIQWTYQLEEDDSLRIRLEGAKRFARCKGVDVIYFTRAKSEAQQ